MFVNGFGRLHVVIGNCTGVGATVGTAASAAIARHVDATPADQRRCLGCWVQSSTCAGRGMATSLPQVFNILPCSRYSLHLVCCGDVQAETNDASQAMHICLSMDIQLQLVRIRKDMFRTRSF